MWVDNIGGDDKFILLYFHIYRRPHRLGVAGIYLFKCCSIAIPIPCHMNINTPLSLTDMSSYWYTSRLYHYSSSKFK
jgi:hypothetical protein